MCAADRQNRILPCISAVAGNPTPTTAMLRVVKVRTTMLSIEINSTLSFGSARGSSNNWGWDSRDTWKLKKFRVSGVSRVSRLEVSDSSFVDLEIRFRPVSTDNRTQLKHIPNFRE